MLSAYSKSVTKVSKSRILLFPTRSALCRYSVSHLDTFLLLLVLIQGQADGYINADGNIKADDMVLLADNWSDLTTMLDTLSTSCKKLSLAISCKKTKSLAVLPPGSPNVQCPALIKLAQGDHRSGPPPSVPI